jgi:hypothetical protein
MTDLVSPCCGKPVAVGGPNAHKIFTVPGQTFWYECSACGKPCDPVEVKVENDADLS